jgi:dUTP pyrophosphatase
MKIMLDEGAKMPTRAHPWDAGLDLYTPIDCTVPPAKTMIYFSPMGSDWNAKTSVGSLTMDTGVHVEIPEGYVGFIKSKSGLNVRYGLTADGVIDAHYTGSIAVKLYNHTRHAYQFKAGDKIAQLVIVPCLLPELEVVDSLEETDRGDNGFGSTGR